MNLLEANKQLEQIMGELEVEIPILTKLEEEYYHRFYDLIVNSPMGNAQAREAYAKEVCRTEGVSEPYLMQKLKVRILLHKKEMIIEISRNLRSLNNS